MFASSLVIDGLPDPSAKFEDHTVAAVADAVPASAAVLLGTTLDAVELSVTVPVMLVWALFRVMFSAAVITQGSPTSLARLTLFWKGVVDQSFVGSGGVPRRRNEFALLSEGTARSVVPSALTTFASDGPGSMPSAKPGTTILVVLLCRCPGSARGELGLELVRIGAGARHGRGIDPGAADCVRAVSAAERPAEGCPAWSAGR